MAEARPLPPPALLDPARRRDHVASSSTSSLVAGAPSPWPGWPSRDEPSGTAIELRRPSTSPAPTGGSSRSWFPTPPWSLTPSMSCKLANTKLDECRRRVQNETLGHRGRKHDPLYRCRRLLTKAKERLDDKDSEKLLGLLRAGDPHGDVATLWEAKEAVRELYAHADADLALDWVDRARPRPPGHRLPDRGPLARSHPAPVAEGRSPPGTTPTSPTDRPRPSTT